jgi:thiamine pyrophosphate-dependent acetolactate synthase large subunit-like protein
LIALRPDGVNVQAFEAVERPPGGLSRRRVRPEVALFPVTLIRPDQEAEPLNQTVVAGAARDRASHVFGEPARLRRAQQREVVATAARLKAPLAHTSRGKDFLEYDNPYNVGMTGILGARAGYHAILDCDVLLLLRADFAWRQFYPDSGTIIQIDADPTHIGRRHPVMIGAVGDIKTTLDALLPRLAQHDDNPFLAAHLERHRKDVETAKAETLSGPDAAISGTLGLSGINRFEVWG